MKNAVIIYCFIYIYIQIKYTKKILYIYTYTISNFFRPLDTTVFKNQKFMIILYQENNHINLKINECTNEIYEEYNLRPTIYILIIFHHGKKNEVIFFRQVEYVE